MRIFKRASSVDFKKFLFLAVIFLIGIGFGYRFVGSNKTVQVNQAEKGTPKTFILEVYDKIKENYWDNLSDAQLLDLFRLSIDKNGGQVQVAKFENKEKMLTAITDSLNSMDESKKNQFIANVAGSVLASLNPPGRSGLYTQKQ